MSSSVGLGGVGHTTSHTSHHADDYGSPIGHPIGGHVDPIHDPHLGGGIGGGLHGASHLGTGLGVGIHDSLQVNRPFFPGGRFNRLTRRKSVEEEEREENVYLKHVIRTLKGYLESLMSYYY